MNSSPTSSSKRASATNSSIPKVHHVPIFVESSGATINRASSSHSQGYENDRRNDNKSRQHRHPVRLAFDENRIHEHHEHPREPHSIDPDRHSQNREQNSSSINRMQHRSHDNDFDAPNILYSSPQSKRYEERRKVYETNVDEESSPLIERKKLDGGPLPPPPSQTPIPLPPPPSASPFSNDFVEASPQTIESTYVDYSLSEAATPPTIIALPPPSSHVAKSSPSTNQMNKPIPLPPPVRDIDGRKNKSSSRGENSGPSPVIALPPPPPTEHSSFARPSQRSNLSGSIINLPDHGLIGGPYNVDVEDYDNSDSTSPALIASRRQNQTGHHYQQNHQPMWKTKIEVKGKQPSDEHATTRCWVGEKDQQQPIVLKTTASENETNTQKNQSENSCSDSRGKEKENMNVILAVERIKLEVDSLVNQIHNYRGVSCDDRDYKILDEMLTRCMLKLDKVDCLNQERLRQTRKAAIKQVNDAIILLEEKVQKNSMAPR